MAQRGNGEIIGPANVPTNQVATGVWNLEEQQIAKSLGAWPSDYRISRSLRFNSADSAYLNRTPASAGNRKTWTWSGWVKRGTLGVEQPIFSAGDGTENNATFISITSGNQFALVNTVAGVSNVLRLETSPRRDSSAWYHLVIAFDSSVTAPYQKVYVNGAEITAFNINTNTISQNQESFFGAAVEHRIGRYTFTNTRFFDGLLTEVNFIDGQALTPSSFGITNPDTGVWQPKPYTGTYGTNGFYLNFSDNSNTTATTLGKDYSGNGNNWTPNNFSVAAGPGNDSMVDVPTPWGVDTGLGGQVRGSYCTLNPISIRRNFALSNGNLAAVNNGNNDGVSTGTIALPATGKWYWEARQGPLNGGVYLLYTGLLSKENFPNDTFANAPGAMVYPRNTAVCFYNNSGTANCISENCVEGDVYGVAYDADAATVNFYKNGVLYSGQTVYVTPGVTYYPFLSIGNQGPTATINFGQQPFIYPAPAGFKTLCTQNLPTPTVGATASTQAGKYFNTVLWTGNSTPRSITGVGFQPDLVWARLRDTTSDYGLFDSVRGATKRVRSNTTDAEDTISGVTSFDADGFSLGTSYNGSPWLYVGWNWKANGAGVTNTAGSITSTVSANTTSGFSVVTYTGNASGGATIGHGLGSAPKMVIIKNRGATSDWIVGHSSLTSWGYFLKLNTTAAQASASTVWNNTAPTSTVVTLGSDGAVNGSTASMVAYCFAEVQGFSRFGNYTGNGSSTDGPFVFCGFRPAYVVVKRTDGTSTDYVWWAQDNKRGPYNATAGLLALNSVDAENSSALMDFVSNGFKIRNASGSVNANGSNYIFMAFAEAPQKFALAR